MALEDEIYRDPPSTFEQNYRCYPVSFIEKSHLEKGDKIIMPPSALDRLAYLQIDYPMLFELKNPSASKVSHCGVLEFIADEGLIYVPYWMMENMLLQEGDIVNVKNASLSKGTYVKLQPHTTDFLDISNPKAILETSLRSYSCLTTGDTIMVAYNNKKFYIDIVETKPSPAISIIETDCEVDFAPPLDYKEPERPLKSKVPPEVEEEPPTKVPKFNPFSGSARRLDGKPAETVAAPLVQPQKTEATTSGTNGSMPSSSGSRKRSGKLVFGSTADQNSNGTPKATMKEAKQDSSKKEEAKKEEPKFQAFTGKKYSLKN
ncbi:putative ubiquitin fusion degradation protein Ufd1 [Helianthus annuus]|uniref:Putative ubiquitin fusion degradation UFD1 family protein n=1 Tax=Helianthus annuus TaxID=4232 RepID=A0A251VCH1_HELAN|nr:ubiquitin fusion degradation protein 1 homolog [Helianthus annuus]XP_022010428.1 ubiquitin fusion degradation protein 1 homolog [Helianthus annuus]KAF5821556.1 putative ubiquitin fusion degradation protein Ufd1 [Helianthus annuus]KAJ0611210.1 putative ubiquitin fusion degradation protein Ufd1 [Helianthus annuus]KAJ0622179.1 putative ubiquitin fusion degradation protein Ufd1 [Helianthus annuus]KAJ0626487.1 putative ubiquitin fusion degradation protein Ufd1 [Helianthus annuus]KAJ0782825.1 pu